MKSMCNLCIEAAYKNSFLWHDERNRACLKSQQGLVFHTIHTNVQQNSLLYRVFSITKCIQLEIPVGSPSLKNRISSILTEPHSGLLGELCRF